MVQMDDEISGGNGFQEYVMTHGDDDKGHGSGKRRNERGLKLNFRIWHGLIPKYKHLNFLYFIV